MKLSTYPRIIRENFLRKVKSFIDFLKNLQLPAGWVIALFQFKEFPLILAIFSTYVPISTAYYIEYK
jgi:hypothetical protein